MALTGLQIYKLLPQTNCKECGFATCLAFGMKLAAKQAELKLCPYVTDECRQVEPISQVLDGGRQVACHRWQEINRDRSVIQIAPPSAAFLRRRALFEHAATHSSLPSRNS